MAHKTKIGGTAYGIAGGKAKVNGATYSIASGKTLVDGTAYSVGFAAYTYTTTTTTENLTFVAGTTQYTSVTWYYSDSFTFSDQYGSFTLVNPTKITINYDGFPDIDTDTFDNKYFIRLTSASNTMYYAASNTYMSRSKAGSYYLVSLNRGYTTYTRAAL